MRQQLDDEGYPIFDHPRKSSPYAKRRAALAKWIKKNDLHLNMGSWCEFGEIKLLGKSVPKLCNTAACLAGSWAIMNRAAFKRFFKTLKPPYNNPRSNDDVGDAIFYFAKKSLCRSEDEANALFVPRGIGGFHNEERIKLAAIEVLLGERTLSKSWYGTANQ